MPERSEADKAEIDKKIRADIAASDMELQELMDLIFGHDDQGTDSTFGITVLTSGGVISGTAVPHAAWTGRLNDALIRAGASKVVEVRRSIEDSTAEVIAKMKEARDAESRPVPPRGFIHLKDVTVFAGGSSVKLANTRVRLSSIHAWDLGSWTEP
ncbi:hypothetical protein ACX80M_20435 [Pseudarthrobacter sp. MDT1-22]